MTVQQQADVTGALKALHSDAPVRSVYAQADATWNDWDGATARLEAGARVAPNISLFAAGTLDSRGPGAEAGIRWDWSW